jgi:NAD(P)-dependent dehydrogenase (short-subunit alcohol dehydrogenase family)
MTRRFEGRTALVFGAGSVGPGWGNGKAAAVQYAREGARVVTVDINPDAAAQTRDIIVGEGGQSISLACDVTNRAQVADVVRETLKAYGAIDVLHNNVGHPAMGTLQEMTEETWDRAIDLNLKSVMLCCQAVIPSMLERGRGAIVNISSIAAVRYTGYPYPAYYASKAAVNHLTVALALEHAAHGVRVNAIMPGLMDTPHIYQNISGQYKSNEEMVAARNKLSPTGRMGTAWDIAKCAAFLASDDAQFITGQCIAVDGGQTCRC